MAHDPEDFAERKRFDTVTVSRALLQNNATNLRNGVGKAQGDGASSVASINEMGAGHINISTNGNFLSTSTPTPTTL